MNHKKLTYLFVMTAILVNIPDARAQLKAWGRNDFGQIGNGNVINQPLPGSIKISNVTGIGGGSYHTLFLRADGTILASGNNSYGQLGDGTNALPDTFVQVSDIAAASQTAGGGFHSLALLTDGTVRSWGYNLYGQLGNNSTKDSSIPVTAAGLDNVISIAAGLEHSLALKSDGTVWAWGSNTDGQLGDNSQIQRSVPVQVLISPTAPLTGVIAVSAGEYHSIALKSDGTVYIWGNNGHGQLGNDSTSPSYVLTAIQNTTLNNVVQIAAGAYHNVALKADGSVFVWGRNTEGEAGNGSSGANGIIYQLTPVQTSISGVTDIRSGKFHALARKIDGSIFAWGSNLYGQIGDGSTDAAGCSCKAMPVQSAISAGNAIFGAGGFHNFVISPHIRTNRGYNVNFQGDSVKITFDKIITAGITSYAIIDAPESVSGLPSGWTFARNFPAYNFNTTAKTSGFIQICLTMPNISDRTQFKRLRLLQYEGEEFTDRTFSIFYQNRQICARTNSLSAFVVGTAPSKQRKFRN